VVPTPPVPTPLIKTPLIKTPLIKTLGRRAVTLGLLAAVGAAVTSTNRWWAQAPGTAAGDGAPVLSRAGLVSAGQPQAPAPSSSSLPTAPRDLPRGGRVLLPTYRLVGYCGVPGSSELGRLGVGDLEARVAEVLATGRLYAGKGIGGELPGPDGRILMPVLELIAVVAHRSPGTDGLFRSRVADDVVATHLAAARRHKGLLLLNVQPGRARFVDEVRAFERWLREPDVGVALDPEWSGRAPFVPGRVYGSVTGAELDDVAAYLSSLVRAGDLPEKAMVVHQVDRSVIRRSAGLGRHDGVVVIKGVDGIGSPVAKTDTWSVLVSDLPGGMRTGIKIFFTEDRADGSPLMSPQQVLALRPQPDYVMYE
jgi:hypothetical protein